MQFGGHPVILECLDFIMVLELVWLVVVNLLVWGIVDFCPVAVLANVVKLAGRLLLADHK
jgi:hypothetical protein